MAGLLSAIANGEFPIYKAPPTSQKRKPAALIRDIPHLPDDDILYNPNLDIVTVRTRYITILQQLLGDKIPHYEQPIYDRATTLDSNRNAQMRAYSKRKREDSEYATNELANNAKANKNKRKSHEYRTQEQARDTSARKKSRDNSKRSKGYNQNLAASRTENHSVNSYRLSPFTTECDKCSAIHFNEEKTQVAHKSNNAFTDCCAKGDIKIAPISYPNELKQLFANREFVINIRKYNTLPSFASPSCNRVKFDKHGPFCYKIHGSVYTQINLLLLMRASCREMVKYTLLIAMSSRTSTRKQVYVKRIR